MRNSLTPEAIDLALSFLRGFGRETRKRGELCYLEGHVVKVACQVPDTTYGALVRDPFDYWTTLHFEDAWHAICSCPMRGGCRHAYAAMMGLLAEHGVRPPEASEEEIVEPPRPRRKETDHTRFLRMTEEGLGRKPRSDELRFLNKLGRLYAESKRRGGLFAAELDGDLEALMEQLEPLMEEGHKVLVFSQFVELLRLVRDAVEGRDWPLFLLTGETERRGELVERFQTAKGGGVFLISLKAGGFGLNLTAASYVVLFDPWWNPAVESQAIDRTHRIGQTSKVIAYRLLITNSIEEKIRGLQKQKSALAEDVLGEERFSESLSLDDLRFLFAD